MRNGDRHLDGYRCWITCAVGLAVGLAWLFVVNRCAADDHELVERIVNDWRERQRISGVRYVVEGTYFIPKGFLSEPNETFPLEDESYPQRIVYYLDFENNRVRIERHGVEYFKDLTKRIPRDTYWVQTFDGRVCMDYYPRARNDDLFRTNEWANDVTVYKEGDRSFFFQKGDSAVMLPHGITPPTTWGFWRTGRLKPQLTSDAFVVHGRASRDGRACVVLRTAPHLRKDATWHELWVDVERRSAILRYLAYHGDDATPLKRLDMWYGEEAGGHYPLLRYEVCDGLTGELVVMYDMNVVEWERNPSFDKSLFRVEIRPGFNVDDLGAGRRYRKGAPGEPDRDLKELYLEQQRAKGAWKRWLLAFGGTVLLLVVGWWIVRRGRGETTAAVGRQR